jgi:hypothetical protein
MTLFHGAFCILSLSYIIGGRWELGDLLGDLFDGYFRAGAREKMQVRSKAKAGFASMVTFLFGMVCLSSVVLAQAPDVVVMIDLTGSTSKADLEKEREAARGMLESFRTITPRPRVAVGSFNVTQEKATSAVDAARIQTGAGLTAEYGDRASNTGLFKALTDLPNPDGYTDIGAAINVAQAHLESNPGTGQRFIVIISDGTSNRPGPVSYSGCTPCGCDNAQKATRVAATEAKNKGTVIYGVHYEGNAFNSTCPNEPAAGLAFIKESIVSSSDTFYESVGDLKGMFTKITCAVRCDDQNACTVDSCSPATGQCEFVPSVADSDSDGVLDCRDTCRGNDASLGSFCNNTATSCSSAGYFGCNQGGAVECLVDPKALAECTACTEIDVSTSIAAIRAGRISAQKGALGAIKKFKKALKARGIALSKKDKAVEANMKKLFTSGQALVDALPPSFSQCQNMVLCSSVFNDSKYDQLKTEAGYYSSQTKAFQGKLKKLVGSASKSDKKALGKVKEATGAVISGVDSLPRQYSICN